MNKNIYLLLLLILIGGLLDAQVLRNDGKINVVTGGYLVISGNYQNETSGDIVLEGTIKLTGNWTNNAANSVMSTTNGTGTVLFAGSGLQTIGGTSANSFNFEGITVNAGASVEVTAGMGITAAGSCNFTANPLILRTTTTAYRPIMATFINNSTVTGNISSEFRYTTRGGIITKAGRSYYFSPSSYSPDPPNPPLVTSDLFDPEGSVGGTNPFSHFNFSSPRAWVRISDRVTPLITMNAYGIRSATSQTFTITGAPNDQTSYSVSLPCSTANNMWYMVGNPYPAVINWDSITLPSDISTTIYYRTSNTTTGVMCTDTYVQNGVGTCLSDPPNGTSVDGKIPPMQAFWVMYGAVHKIFIKVSLATISIAIFLAFLCTPKILGIR
jgi:hypothetical protein